jgi:hypothetical protein
MVNDRHSPGVDQGGDCKYRPKMSAVIELPDTPSALVREGYSYWRAKGGAAPMPARSDCDPLLEVPYLAPSLMLKDVRRSPLDFRYRLV